MSLHSDRCDRHRERTPGARCICLAGSFDITGPTDKGADGIDRSHRHAEADAPGWTETAALALGQFAQTVEDFTIDQARQSDVVRAAGEPDELRAWGAATQRATREKLIRRTERYRSADSSNGSPKPVYERGEA